jgi:hypothetical protein
LRRLLIEIVIASIVWASGVRADDPATAAKAHFERGAALVKQAQWAEALEMFKQADEIKSHAITTYNIGVCQRAMGQYVRARQTFARALAQNEEAHGAQLPDAIRDDTRSLITEIDGLLATITMTVDPPTAAVTFDGRPLQLESTNGVPVLVAGVRPAGSGDKPPAPTFVVRSDPGGHVIAITRGGYSDAVYNRVLAPGSKSALSIKLDSLPATLRIASDPAGAAVMVAGVDVGITPVDVVRPAGTYPVVVRKAGYVAYEGQLTARAGESAAVRWRLPQEKLSVTSRWWFWTGVVIVVGGAIAGTALGVLAAQPKTRPPLYGGGLGWSAPAQ